MLGAPNQRCRRVWEAGGVLADSRGSPEKRGSLTSEKATERKCKSSELGQAAVLRRQASRYRTGAQVLKACLSGLLLLRPVRGALRPAAGGGGGAC